MCYIRSFPRPEQHILLFRRPLGTDPITGNVDPELEREAKEQYYQSLAVAQRK
jgi:cyclin-dependent kinase regulatory subunit CKS1